MQFVNTVLDLSIIILLGWDIYLHYNRKENK